MEVFDSLSFTLCTGYYKEQRLEINKDYFNSERLEK